MNGAKVVFIGDSGVGKTCLISVGQGLQYSELGSATIGSMSVTISKTTKQGTSVNLSIWDTAGQEEFQSLIPRYAKGAKAAVVCFSLSEKRTFKSIPAWLNVIKENEVPNIFIVGTKADLEHEVTNEDAVDFCDNVRADYFETSAKQGRGIDDLFSAIAEAVDSSNVDENEVILPTVIDIKEAQQVDKKKRC